MRTWMLFKYLKICCGPLVNETGPCGFAIVLSALAGPILLLTGGAMFAVHKPHRLVEGRAALYAVQGDRYWPDPLPQTYSWCRYSLQVDCPADDQTDVPTRARRDDFAYNGISRVSKERCFEDVTILNNATLGGGGFTAAACLASDGDIICTQPRPVILAYYDKDKCANGVWTLNNPEESITRFLVILAVGGVLFLCGWVPMIGLWMMKGCPTDGDVYL